MANLRRSSSVRPAVSGAPQGVGWDWNSCGYSTPRTAGAGAGAGKKVKLLMRHLGASFYILIVISSSISH